MSDYKSKKALVVGLGRSGLAAARFLAQEGARVTVTDNRLRSEFDRELKALSEFNIEYVLGSNPTALFTTHDLVVVSPGVPLDIEGVRKAKEQGIPVVCELELGLARLKGEVVAITGTNGKSTTTALIGEMLKRSGKNVWVGGNIGRPLIDGIGEAQASDYVVLELSSYQLETTPTLRPHMAVWLNATPDHLDRYTSFDHYVRAKALIGSNQDNDDWVIFNHDDQLVCGEVKSFKSHKLPFSTYEQLELGAWYEGRGLRLKAREFDFGVDISVSKIQGAHNKENIAAASLVAALCGLGKEEIEGALSVFGGLPHRLQFVREFNGVRYFDDSKGTNVGAVVRSIESFDSPIVLIAGGQDKNTGYQELREAAHHKVRRVLAIGEAAERIRQELGDLIEVTVCQSMGEAVDHAAATAVEGDVVLLSPACASFDMYKDYTERGEDFVNCVNRLE